MGKAVEPDAKILAVCSKLQLLRLDEVDSDFGQHADIVTAIDGSFVMPKNDEVIRPFILATGGYERPTINFIKSILQPYLKERSLVLDVGSNVGVWSVPLAQALQPLNGEVYAFEAQRNLINHLDATLVLNSISNVHSIHGLVSNVTGEREIRDIMYDSTPVDYSKLSVNNEMKVEESTDRTEVSTVSSIKLDTFYENELERTCPVFIKMDIENHELEALIGGLNVFTVCKPLLLFDASCPALNKSTFKFLWSLGYSLSWVIRTIAEFDIAFEDTQTVDSIRHYKDLDEVSFNKWFFGGTHALAMPDWIKPEQMLKDHPSILRPIVQDKFGVGEYEIKYCIDGFSHDGEQDENPPRCGFIYSEDDDVFLKAEGLSTAPCESRATRFALDYNKFFD
eukprot:gene31310-37839_t